MKNYKNLGIYDFSDYAEEITGDDLFKGSGGPSGGNNPGGTCYYFIPKTWTETFQNPIKMNWINKQE